MSIIDTPWNTAAKAAALAAAGVTAVLRYYNFANSRSLPEKCLTATEARALSAAGIAVGVVFQQMQNATRYFSRQEGERAGERALWLARDTIGQPEGSAIYFAVDYDAGAQDVDSAIASYFEGVHAALGSGGSGGTPYRVGAYGSGLVCDRLRDRGLIDLAWLSLSRGFRGTREALAAGRYDLQQTELATIVGLPADLNEANPDGDGFGAFTVADAAPPATASPPAPAPAPGEGRPYRVAARSGLRLRAGPGTDAAIVGGLPDGRVVHVLDMRDGWARVDADADGTPDGYAAAAYLTPAD